MCAQILFPSANWIIQVSKGGKQRKGHEELIDELKIYPSPCAETRRRKAITKDKVMKGRLRTAEKRLCKDGKDRTNGDIR